jgi:hypothetical protein
MTGVGRNQGIVHGVLGQSPVIVGYGASLCNLSRQYFKAWDEL